jgi:formylglycine-generating enzyme required for sulfatase activity
MLSATMLWTGTAFGISIDTVTIGNPGNTADSATGYGSVSYEYQIGKYEVTSGQYAAFLNEVAKTSDTYNLYNANMWNDPRGCKIQRTGSEGNWTYTATSASLPVNYVSFYDAARFANWLTSGDTESGLYEFDSETHAFVGVADHATSSVWVIASEDEWYKAAYYKGNGEYSSYPNGTSSISGSGANYWGSGNGENLIGVGLLAEEQNGTYDMAGNVWEWTDTLISGTSRVVRGGAFYFDQSILAASERGGFAATYEDNFVGFRVVLLTAAAVPEPATYAALAGVVLLAYAVVRRRKS